MTKLILTGLLVLLVASCTGSIEQEPEVIDWTLDRDYVHDWIWPDGIDPSVYDWAEGKNQPPPVFDAAPPPFYVDTAGGNKI